MPLPGTFFIVLFFYIRRSTAFVEAVVL